MTENQRRTGLFLILLFLIVGIILGFVLWQPKAQRGFMRPASNAMSVELDDDAPKPDVPLEFQAVSPETAETLNAARPDYIGDIIAARGFAVPKSDGVDGAADRALDCLAAAIYYEARSESLQGQRAVAQVVLNRVRDPLYPASVCGVVFQGSERITGCQFSFTCDGSLAAPPREPMWTRSRAVARAALNGYVEASVGLASHYHTQWVVPVWRTDLVKLRTIGAHIFYGWRGRQSSSAGLRTSYAGFEPPLLPGFAAETAIAEGEEASDMMAGGFAAQSVENGPIGTGGSPAPPPSTPLSADIRAGAMIARDSQLKVDDAPVPLSKLAGALPK
jgi:spore germination cell wall hydrolase CwlJ-like protein